MCIAFFGVGVDPACTCTDGSGSSSGEGSAAASASSSSSTNTSSSSESASESASTSPGLPPAWAQCYRFVLAANRDETLARPTAPMHWWLQQEEEKTDASDAASPTTAPQEEAQQKDPAWVLAGRDMVGGGTWLGVTAAGRLAVLTNVRVPAEAFRAEGVRSRGQVLVDWLARQKQQQEAEDGGDDAATTAGDRLEAQADAFCARLRDVRREYNPFNLLVGDLRPRTAGSGSEAALLRFFSTGFEVGVTPAAVDAPACRDAASFGTTVHGFSNGSLDDAWPKVRRGRAGVSGVLSGACAFAPTSSSAAAADETAFDVRAAEALFSALDDDVQVTEERHLPRTGGPLDMEKVLSGVFVRETLASLSVDAVKYATRSQCVVLVRHDGAITVIERSRVLDKDGNTGTEADAAAAIAAAAVPADQPQQPPCKGTTRTFRDSRGLWIESRFAWNLQG